MQNNKFVIYTTDIFTFFPTTKFAELCIDFSASFLSQLISKRKIFDQEPEVGLILSIKRLGMFLCSISIENLKIRRQQQQRRKLRVHEAARIGW